MTKIGSLVGQGASLFSTAVRDVPMEGKDKSSLKRPCVIASKWCDAVRESCHGCGGVKVGEASNPGAHDTLTRSHGGRG